MKKKIFSLTLLLVLLFPCLFLFTACGELKTLSNKTLVFSKVEVTGDLNASDYELMYKNCKFTFSKDSVVCNDGTSDGPTNYFKVEDGKVYIRAEEDEEYSSIAYAELSGKYMIVTQTVGENTVKVYFAEK